MPTRRFHFTQRQRISSSDVTIRLYDDRAPAMFEVQRLVLEPYSLPPDARVSVEAYRQTVCQRFPWGTVASRNPSVWTLEEFGSTEGVRFRIKVTARTTPRGQLLAIADRIAPVTELGAARSFLPIELSPLGEEVFRVAWDSSDEPILLVNERIGKEVVQSPEFRALAMPAVMREILTRFVVVERRRPDVDDSSLCTRWLSFGIRMAGGTTPPEVTDSNDSDVTDDCFAWIEDAVKGFCEHYGLGAKFETTIAH